MSGLDDFFALAAASAMEAIGPVQVRRGLLSKPAIVSPITNRRELRDAGLWAQAQTVAEFLRADFVALALEPQWEVFVGEQNFRVTNVDDDPHDPCVRVGLTLVRK